jgi:uncharacterized membrane protein YfcA
LGRFAQTCARIIAFPFRVIVRVGDALLAAVWFLLLRFLLTVKFLGKTSVLTLTGVLVGAAAGVWFGMANQNLDVTVPLNAAIGGVIGTLVGAALILMEKKSTRIVHPIVIRPMQPQMKV